MWYAAQWSFDLTQWLVCIEPLLFGALNQLEDNMCCTFYISIGIRRWRQSKRKQFRNSSWHCNAIIRSDNSALRDSSSVKTALSSIGLVEIFTSENLSDEGVQTLFWSILSSGFMIRSCYFLSIVGLNLPAPSEQRLWNLRKIPGPAKLISKSRV